MMQERIDWLISRACIYTRADKDNLLDKSRKRELVYTRYIVWYNLRNSTPMSLTELGNIFNLHYATVLAGLRIYSNLFDTDSKFAEEAALIEQEFWSKFNPIRRTGKFIHDLSYRVFSSHKTRSTKDIARVLIGI